MTDTQALRRVAETFALIEHRAFVAGAADDIDELQAALEKYGLHEAEYPINNEPWTKKPCNCGLGAYQQRTGEQK